MVLVNGITLDQGAGKHRGVFAGFYDNRLGCHVNMIWFQGTILLYYCFGHSLSFPFSSYKRVQLSFDIRICFYSPIYPDSSNI